MSSAKAATKPQAPATAQARIFAALCVQSGLPAPVPEYQFYPGRKWRIDYFFSMPNGRKVALEVEGGAGFGRHTRRQGFLADMEKYNALTTSGIWLLRCTPSTLLSADTINNLRMCATL